jgi:surfeit locus 1 family protein
MVTFSPAARRGLMLAAALLAVALTARLGFWQLDRAAQKQALRAAIEQQGALPPLAATELAADAGAAVLQHHRRIEVTGRWLPRFTVFLDNRQMAGRPGFFVVTPLLLAPGDAVLVLRGWVPRDAQERTRLPQVPADDGPVHLLARVAPPPSRLLEFSADEAGPIRQNLDPDAYSREIGVALRPVALLQLGPEGGSHRDGPSPGGLLRDWPVPAPDLQKHHGYAFQWFALSTLIAGLYVWFQLLRPRLDRRRP